MAKMFLYLNIFCSLISTLADAQSNVTGVILEQTSRKPMFKVEILNLNSKENTISNEKGEFTIKANVNDLLTFYMPGFKADTLMLATIKPLRRYLETETNTLKQVNVTSPSLREQYSETFNSADPTLLKAGRGFLFYPSGYFSEKGKQAHRLKKMIKKDEIELQIDKRFNAKSITEFLPIQQPQLDAFMLRYRPSLNFVKKADKEDFKFYLFDAYKKFKLLPQSEQILPSLK